MAIKPNTTIKFLLPGVGGVLQSWSLGFGSGFVALEKRSPHFLFINGLVDGKNAHFEHVLARKS